MEPKKFDPEQKNEMSPADFNPFPEPNTFPKGWNMDDILTSIPEPQAQPQALPEWYEHFRDPHTFPSGWDLG